MTTKHDGVLLVDDAPVRSRLVTAVRTVVVSDQAEPAPVHVQIKPTAEGKLRLTIDAPVVEFDRNAALDIARTIKKLAMALPPGLPRTERVR